MQGREPGTRDWCWPAPNLLSVAALSCHTSCFCNLGRPKPTVLYTCNCRAGMLPSLKRPRTFVSTANVLSLVGMGAATGSPDLQPPSIRQALQACAGLS